MRIPKNGLKAAGIAIALLAGLSPAASAFALPAFEVDTVYYADASMTEEVGETILTCGASHGGWGVQTPYSRTTYTPCGNGEPYPF